MIPTLIAGSLAVVAATAGMGKTGSAPDPAAPSAPTRFELASARRAALHGPGAREAVSGATTTTTVKSAPTTTTTAPPPPPSTTTTTEPPPEPEPEPAAGEIVCPVDGPVSFVDSFGAPRSGHRHQGVDMMAARGVPTVAPVSGTVEHNESTSGGLAWYVHGDNGDTYFGAHLSGFAAAGWVEAGTVIGYVGSTGNASGGSPHLHFEYHPGGGGAVDPYNLVSAAC